MSKHARFFSLLLAMALLVGAGWWARGRIKTPGELDSDAAIEPSYITATVEMRVLSTNIRTRGDVVSIGSVDVRAGTYVGSGEPIVTRAPPQPGARVREGDVIAEVALRPVFVLQGSIPVFRDLTPDADGADVRQLQAALRRLGFDPGPVDGHYRSRTSDAVRAFYQGAGFEPLEDHLRVGEPEGAQTDATPGFGVPRAEVVFVPALPAVVRQVYVGVGDLASGPLVTLSFGGLVVDTSIRPSDRVLVDVGSPALVTGGVLDVELPAVIQSIDARPAPIDGAPDSIAVRLRFLEQPDQRLAASNVLVIIPVESTHGPALVVPTAAVSSDANGLPFVQVLEPEGVVRRVIVNPGLSFGGFVEVATIDGALSEGDEVIVGR